MKLLLTLFICVAGIGAGYANKQDCKQFIDDMADKGIIIKVNACYVE